MKKLLLMFICLLSVTTLFGQGSTTSSMRGQIIDTDGTTLIGANVVAKNESTGATYGNSSDVNGNYRIANMRIGGPYTVTVTYTGYQTQVKKDVFLKLGEPYIFNVTLTTAATGLDEVVVTAERSLTGSNDGASTSISEDDINLMPTLDRNINDFTRLTPQAKQTNGGFSIAGTNNRFNAIYIDGAVNNDVFGLAGSGTNGGQTGISPFSIDIVEQIQVVVSPYDVTLGGFAGGGINAVTKSGTNKFEGTAYYFVQNEGLAGKTNGELIDRVGGERTKLDEFTQKIYGFSLAGPILKDKIHFFANVELQDDETPVPFDFGTYRGNSSETDLNQLSTFLQTQYGYNPGAFGSKSDKLEGVKLFGKLTFNLSQNHKLTLRHQYTKAEQTNVNGSDDNDINFENNGVYFPSTTHSFAAELSSSFGSTASNNLIIGYTSVFDDRDPIGSDFPYLNIDDGDGTIRIGSEQFSTANQLDQKILTITDNFELYKGKHTFTFGTHNEFYDIYNLFIRQNYGVYEFSSVASFMAGDPADAYDRSYSLVDNITGDGSAAGAEFNAFQLGFYAQDQIQVNQNFTFTGGLRIDIPFITTTATVASDFNSSTLPLIANSYDVSNAKGGDLPQGQIMVSPRLGFNYDLTEKKVGIIRGGIGIFTSRVPFVWPGGAYSNNGLNIGGVNENDLTDPIVFQPGLNDQYTNPNFTTPSGQIDLFADDFKYPQVLRTSLALDRTFGKGWTATVEGIFTKTLNNIFYQNVNSDPTVDFTWTGGPDNRQVFNRSSIDPTYSAIYLATNTSKGYSYNFTAQVAKKFDFGLDFFMAYTYGDSESIFEGTSSQNSSQWRGAFTVNGRNNALIGRSDFSAGSRLISGVNFVKDWDKTGNFKTSISIFYEGASGNPYSYVYGNRDARNLNNETGSTSRNRSLIWIPADASEINLIDIAGGATAAQQWEALNRFIEDDNYLSNNRGGYAEKNGSRTPFTSQFDLRIAQDLGFKNQRLQLSLDIFNFANLLNKNWGVVYNNPFDYQLIDFEGYEADGTTPQFTFDDDRLGDERFNIQSTLSRWRGRLGIRYIFN